MSAFNQVSRLTTTNPLKMHHHRHLSGHHHKHAHGPPLMEVAAGDEHDGVGPYGDSGQRKWRVLISIGLLLPALAAIIGIVAWTISIEVANSGASPVTSGAATSQAAASALVQARRAERLQRQQQFRRDEAASLAAIIGARNRNQQQQQQQQRTSRPELPVSAPLVQAASETLAQQVPQVVTTSSKASNPTEPNEKNRSNELMNDDQNREEAKPNRRASTQSGTPSRPTRTSQRQSAPSMKPQQQPVKPQAGQGRSASDSSRSANMDQLETLTSSSMETQSKPDAKTLDTERPVKNRKRDDSQQMRAVDEEQANKKRADEQMAAGAGEDEKSPDSPQSGRDETDSETLVEMPAGGSNAADAASAERPSEQDQGFEQQVHIDHETLTSGAADEPVDEKLEQVRANTRLEAAMSLKSKANRLALDSKRAPAKSSLETGKKLASAKQVYSEIVQKSRKRGDRFDGIKSSHNSHAKSNSKYKLVSSIGSSSEDEADQVAATSTTTTTTTTTPPPPSSTTATTSTTTTVANVRDCDQMGGERRLSSESQDQEGETRSDSSSDSESEPMGSNSDSKATPGATQEEVSFEAIASAISKNLSDNSEKAADAREGEAPARAMAELLSEAIANNARQMSRQSAQAEDEATDSMGPTLVSAANGDGAKEASSGGSSDGPTSSDELPRQMAAKRRRTTGEHLAEVIDHIVDKRRLTRFGERTAGGSGADASESSSDVPEGPQIVVVAPVGLDGRKARSLTREPAKVESKAQVSKKSIEPAKKKSSQKPVRIGARLLGADSNDSNQAKFSEKVEVIEDDDSSALLMPQPALVQPIVKSSPHATGANEMMANPEVSNDDDEEEQEEQKSGERNQMASERADIQMVLNNEQLSSVHVASNSGQPRSRSPRHEASSRYLFERYAPMTRQPQPQTQQQHPHYHQQQQQQQQQKQPRQEKLYSAEQVIMDHMLKSKARSSSEQPKAPNGSSKPQAQEGISTTAASTSSTTTGQPITSAVEGNQREASNQQQQPARQNQSPRPQPEPVAMAPSDERPTEVRSAQPNQQRPAKQMVDYSNMQPVQVPALFIQQSNQMHRPHHFIQYDPYQTMESQQQQQTIQMLKPATSYEPHNQEATGMETHREQQPAGDTQYQQQPALPVFADQEIQVPAHMAESVIRDLQQSSSTVRGLYNGQPALFQAQPANSMMHQQVPQQPQQQHHLSQQLQQHHHQMMLMMQQQQRAHQMAQAEESRLKPAFAHSDQHPPQPPQTSYLRQAFEYSPLGLVSRLARRQPHEHQNQDQMVSRASNKDESRQLQQQQQNPQEGSLIDTAVKALGPKGIIQPVAQMALKNLLSSLSQQAAAQQAQADAVELRQGASSSNQQRSSLASVSQQTPEGANMLEAGSSPAAILAEAPGGRSMRSLPIGAQAPLSQQQLQPLGGAASGVASNDQDVQESYGQMPTYHMAPPHHPPYQGDNYQGEHDKKTKGITFHFGGGPIGGGTQLITSPMGIFKHLMIPLMPNPRVNLNGKVVFGVVLEKSTAFGPPPKKKYKFWG